MELNYYFLAGFIVAIVALIVFLILRNKKEQKKFEREVIDSETKVEKHKDDRL